MAGRRGREERRVAAVPRLEEGLRVEQRLDDARALAHRQRRDPAGDDGVRRGREEPRSSSTFKLGAVQEFVDLADLKEG